jgi:hypothetical protein
VRPVITNPQLSEENLKEKEKENWSRDPDGGLTPGQTGRLTVSQMTLTLTLMIRNMTLDYISVRVGNYETESWYTLAASAALSLFGHPFLWLRRCLGPPQPKPRTTKRQEAAQTCLVPVGGSTPVINYKTSCFLLRSERSCCRRCEMSIN